LHVQNVSTSYLIYPHKLHPTMIIFLGAFCYPVSRLHYNKQLATGIKDCASIILILQQS